MSFDVVFTARADGSSASRKEIADYFKQNMPAAKVTAKQIIYENEVTEADFIIDFEENSKAPMTLYLNLIRPSIWPRSRHRWHIFASHPLLPACR